MRTVYDMYGPQVLDALIRQKLILYEADRLNLEPSDTEVESRLRQMFNPWPGPEQYRARLQQAGITPFRFEDDLRASIAQEHLRSFITAAAAVDPKEVEEDYRRSNTTYSVRWVEVEAAKFKDKVQVAEADLPAYFNEHKSEFNITTEQRRARYIFIDQDKAGEAIQISDEDLKPDFKPERFIKQYRVSQIVLNVPKQQTPKQQTPKPPTGAQTAATPAPAADDPEPKIREKAQGIVSRAQKSEGKPAEDFAKLAREFSEDAKTRSKGGDLGWINKDDKRETDDPLNRAFNMKEGEVSEPVKKGDKYYIIKVTERKMPTFADARAELLKDARSRKGYSKAVELAAEAEQKLKETKNAEAVAAEINKNHGAQVAVVKETPFFARGDELPGLGAASELETAVFDLENPNDVSERMNVEKGFAVAQYLEKRDPHEPTFEEVKSKVETAYRAQKARELALERAKELTKAQGADQLKRLADPMALRTDERLNATGNESIGPLVSEADRGIIYKLNAGEVTKEPIKTSDDVYVVAAMISRKDADMGEPFQKERKSIEQRLLEEKRTNLFSTYLSMTQKHLREEGEITVYAEEIAAAVASMGTPQDAGPSRTPPPASSRPRRAPPPPQ